VKAVLLDRDGVINRDRSDYVKSWEEFEFLPGALAGLRVLAQAGLGVAVVSNQSAVGRGLMSARELDLIHQRMVDAVRRDGGRIDAVLCCLHAPTDGCRCRKPRPGLLSDAVAYLGTGTEGAVMVGDNVTDLQAAQAARLPAVLVLSGSGSETLVRPESASCPVTFVAQDLLEAARWAASHERAWPWQ